MVHEVSDHTWPTVDPLDGELDFISVSSMPR
jgi:hypothetical protein